MMNFLNTQAHPSDVSFIKAAMAMPLLSQEDEHRLTCAWHEERNEKALHEITNSYVRLVVSIALRYRHYKIPLSDLIQEGVIGLLEAAERFQPNRNVRFSAYAKWWIRAYIQSFILRNWSIVRTGTTSAHKNLFFSLNRIKDSLLSVSTDDMSDDIRQKISELLKVTVQDVTFMEQRLGAHDFSLSAPTSQEGNVDWQDLLCDTQPTPEENSLTKYQEKKYQLWIEEALQCLNPREVYIIYNRRLHEPSQTLEKLGEDLKITKERVRQLEARAIRKMRYYFLSNHMGAMVHSL
jgi:RNA polymerase sigma-32 factor